MMKNDVGLLEKKDLCKDEKKKQAVQQQGTNRKYNQTICIASKIQIIRETFLYLLLQNGTIRYSEVSM
jgi:hypothetical protein